MGDDDTMTGMSDMTGMNSNLSAPQFGGGDQGVNMGGSMGGTLSGAEGSFGTPGQGSESAISGVAAPASMY